MGELRENRMEKEKKNRGGKGREKRFRRRTQMTPLVISATQESRGKKKSGGRGGRLGPWLKHGVRGIEVGNFQKKTWNVKGMMFN